MCVSVDDHEARFRKDYARGPAIIKSREVYRGIKLATSWPETVARRNPIHPGSGTDLSIFLQTDNGHPVEESDFNGLTEQYMGGDEVPDYFEDEADLQGVDGTDDVIRAHVQAEVLPIIDDTVARCRRALMSQAHEVHRLNQLVTDTTDRVLTDKELLSAWVAQLRQHYAMPFALDNAQRDSILSFGSAVVAQAVLESRSERLRSTIAVFTNLLNGTRFRRSNAPKTKHSNNVLPAPAKKRARRPNAPSV